MGSEESEVSRPDCSLLSGSFYSQLGRMVQVTHGPFKGYFGNIKHIRDTGKNISTTVELAARVGGYVCPYQTFDWDELRVMYVYIFHMIIRCIAYLICFRSVEEETARLNPGPQVFQLATPLPGSEVGSPHALTPEPEQGTLLSYYSSTVPVN